MWAPPCLTVLQDMCPFHRGYSQCLTRSDSWMKTQGAEEGRDTLGISLTNGHLNAEGCQKAMGRGCEVSMGHLWGKSPRNKEHRIKSKCTCLKTSRQWHRLPGLPRVGSQTLCDDNWLLPTWDLTSWMKWSLILITAIAPHNPNVW